MLKSKAILVLGETKIYNGSPVRDIAEKVSKAVESALAGINPEDVVDIKVNTQFMGVSGDQAFILILYKANETKKTQEVKK